MKFVKYAVALLLVLELRRFLPPQLQALIPNFSVSQLLKSSLAQLSTGATPRGLDNSYPFDDEYMAHFDTGLLVSEYDSNNPLHYTKGNTSGYALAGSGKQHMSIDTLNRLKLAFTYDSVYPIGSGYRSPSYNSLIGGSSKSEHMEGCAVDVSTTAENRASFILAAIKAGFTRIGVYNTFIHVDYSKTRSNTTWADNQECLAWIRSIPAIKTALQSLNKSIVVYHPKKKTITL